jgi:hypothetical protein
MAIGASDGARAVDITKFRRCEAGLIGSFKLCDHVQQAEYNMLYRLCRALPIRWLDQPTHSRACMHHGVVVKSLTAGR